MRIGKRARQVQSEVFHISQGKYRDAISMRHLYMREVRPGDIVEQTRWTGVLFFVPDFNIAKRNSFHMANEKTVTRHSSKPVGIGIVFFQFWWLNLRAVRHAFTLVLHQNVVE